MPARGSRHPAALHRREEPRVIDVLVIGSGAAGVNAAWPLVQRGLKVELLDFGNVLEQEATRVPARPWSTLRLEDEEQHRYFLGEHFEGIPLGGVRVGAQLTPPRQFITADTDHLLPTHSASFSATESLALGGLAAGWGAGVFPFDDADLAGLPISAHELQPHYEVVAERIGVSGEHDDLSAFLGDCRAMLPSLELDSAGEQLLGRYGRKRAKLNAAGFFLGKTRLAACSREHRGRGPHPHLDLDFWSDAERAVWRPRWTLDELLGFENFTYTARRLVTRFEERGAGVEVYARHADHAGEERHGARALVLAAGALGSARLVLRSLGLYDRPVPLLCNPYTYVPVLNTAMIGREARDRRHSLAQLTAFQRLGSQGTRLVQAQYYSYRSLLSFKLLKESPLAHRDSLHLMSLLQPLLGIIGIHHEDRPTAAKTCVLRRMSARGADRLELDYRPTREEEEQQRIDEKAILKGFRRLGCLPLRRIRPGHGSAIHYAGGLPMSSEGGELTCDVNGRLAGSRSVYIADGAAFGTLPAKGLTFTIMANANRVGTQLAEELAQ